MILTLFVIKYFQISDLTFGETTDAQQVYGDDEEIPIFQLGKKSRYTLREAVKILTQNTESRRCTKTPLRVRRNISC